MRRYDMRIPTAIKVKVRGTDEQGNSFEQAARTINVSRTGARLEGVTLVGRVQQVELRRGWFHKAKFRVIWAGMPGTPQADQIGLRLLEKDASFWGIPFPPPELQPDYAPPAAAAAAAGTSPFTAPASVLPGKWDAPPPATPTPPRFEGYGSSNDIVPLTWDGSTAKAQTIIRERVASVRVRFTTASGETREESCAVARVLRDRSCIVPMLTALPERAEVTLFNARTNAFRSATVSMCGPQMPDGTFPVAIDLAAPDAAFWGSGSVH